MGIEFSVNTGYGFSCQDPNILDRTKLARFFLNHKKAILEHEKAHGRDPETTLSDEMALLQALESEPEHKYPDIIQRYDDIIESDYCSDTGCLHLAASVIYQETAVEVMYDHSEIDDNWAIFLPAALPWCYSPKEQELSHPDDLKKLLEPYIAELGLPTHMIDDYRIIHIST